MQIGPRALGKALVTRSAEYRHPMHVGRMKESEEEVGKPMPNLNGPLIAALASRTTAQACLRGPQSILHRVSLTRKRPFRACSALCDF
jgi:hypothetical protein